MDFEVTGISRLPSVQNINFHPGLSFSEGIRGKKSIDRYLFLVMWALLGILILILSFQYQNKLFLSWKNMADITLLKSILFKEIFAK